MTLKIVSGISTNIDQSDHRWCVYKQCDSNRSSFSTWMSRTAHLPETVWNTTKRDWKLLIPTPSKCCQIRSNWHELVYITQENRMCVSVFAVTWNSVPGKETMTLLKNTINGRLNVNTSKWWEHPCHKNRDSQDLDRLHPLLEALDWGPVIWWNLWTQKHFTFGEKTETSQCEHC